MSHENTFNFYNNCVNWSQSDIDSLTEVIDNQLAITRATFLKHVNKDDLKELEQGLSYAEHHTQGLTMAGDWHVGYFRSTMNGVRVYGFVHSAIEYVFTSE